jgi:hypothetical protein
MKMIKAVFATIIIFLLFSFPSIAADNCVIDDDVRNEILQKISSGQKDVLNKLNHCYSTDKKLILRACLLDFRQFQYASNILKEDESFIYRLIRVSPNILQFVSPDLLKNHSFMKRSTYLYRDALEYADPQILDNKMFMKEMIEIDSRNYMFASERIKGDIEIAAPAFSDNGLLLDSAPNSIRSNKNLVKIAVDSNVLAIKSASKDLQKDKTLLALVKSRSANIVKEDLTQFVKKTYTTREKKSDLGTIFINRAKFSEKNKIIDRNYITKWQRKFYVSKDKTEEEVKLISADKRNYPMVWKSDFKNHPELIQKIQGFFLKHNVDQNTIDKLATTFLWKVEEKPLTYVFNLYFLRNSKDNDLGPEFSNITSLTAVAEQQEKSWKLSVIEVIFDNEVKTDVAYENGHKRHIFWDINSTNKNHSIIFKVEDRFQNHFEIFAKQGDGKYGKISQIDLKL